MDVQRDRLQPSATTWAHFHWTVFMHLFCVYLPTMFSDKHGCWFYFPRYKQIIQTTVAVYRTKYLLNPYF